MSTLSIIYCAPCGYEKRAREAVEALREATGMTPELVPGKGGVFRVVAGDETLIARAKGFFPTTNDIVSAVRGHLKAGTTST